MKIEKISKLIWQEFIYGGHLLSLGAVSVVYTSSILLDIRITWEFLVVVYSGTEAIYLYNRYKELNKDFLTDLKRSKHLKKFVKIIPLIIVFFSSLFFGTLLYSGKILSLVFAILLFSLSLVYTPFFKKITRKIIAFKSFFVSWIWSLLIMFLAIYYSFSLNLSLFLIFIFVYLRMFVREEFSNIKDTKRDKKEELLTLAFVFEKRKLLCILSLITILATVPIIYGVYSEILPDFSIVLLLTVPYTFYCFKKEQEVKTNEFLYYILVDGEPLLWSVFILLSKCLFR